MTNGVGQSAQAGWTRVIGPDSRWFDLRLGELWRYRDLVFLFVRRDLTAQYKQTLLGPAWIAIQPLLTTITFTIVFGRIAGISTDSLPPFLFYLSGTVLWSYFASCLTRTSNTFVGNANVFGKVYFPRLAVPVSVLISNLVTFLVQFLLFLGFVGFFATRGAPIQPTSWVLLTPFLVILMAGLGLGLGILASSLTSRYRDLTNLVSFGIGLLMFASPVVYPLSTVPADLRPLIDANPITPVIETFRYAYLGAGSVSVGALLYSTGFTLATLLAGVLLFNRVERTFMDTV